MRKLSPVFMRDLSKGFLNPLLNKVCLDVDLDMQIRENYINIYFKGNSLLKLDERQGSYKLYIDRKFIDELVIPKIVDENTLKLFLDNIPKLKENILLHGRTSIETEYEQLMIRANNYQPHNNNEYFILDRQVAAGKAGRFDLTGFFWSRAKRRKAQVVPLCLMEVKYALNPDIQNVDEQIKRYFEAICQDPQSFAEEAETILSQKLELGLFKASKEQLEAMKTLTFFRDISHFRIILVLIDYNPYSKLFDETKFAKLEYADQIRIFKTGLAMWNPILKSIES
jgi:hypothetical protein